MHGRDSRVDNKACPAPQTEVFERLRSSPCKEASKGLQAVSWLADILLAEREGWKDSGSAAKQAGAMERGHTLNAGLAGMQ